jgi:1,4-dihydroxy-2-naphthoate octaprenyltransferase
VATTSEWIQGARPRTLPAAIAPVLVGTGIAQHADSFNIVRALLALVVALALQAGVNYSNDYSDGIRGTDSQRVGPVRLVGQGLAQSYEVKRAAFLMFAFAMVSGLIVVLLTQAWWLLLVGAASVAAAWFYTGGSRPYGYAGFGEIFVFIFFGIVPVMGTAYVQTLELTVGAFIASVGVGALACSILITNNLRDILGDTEHGKLTLAVRLGDARTRKLYVACVAVAFIVPAILIVPFGPWAALGYLAMPWALLPIKLVRRGARGPALIPVLKATGDVLLIYGVVLGLGLAL